ncbi:MAG TPA: glycosyltransferase family 4 protein [Sediminibacterium sp.]|nr:glycosyltransferase family 4 protein [Sediminibacterium sp.]
MKVYRLVKKNKIDTVHVHNFYYKASASVFWAAKLAGAHTILTLHNYRLFCLNGFMYYQNQPCMLCHQEQSFKAGIERKCFKNSSIFSWALAKSNSWHKSIHTYSKKIDRFVVINPLQEQLLIDIGIETAKIRFKSNFLTGLSNTPPPAFETRQSFYLFVGRLSEEKGIKDLVKAFKENGKSLLIVGDGPLSEWVQQETTDKIQYSKAVARESLVALYASCSALVFPSRWFEGQPLTVIEAQSTGAIVIAAYSNNMSKMIEHETNGLLYPIEQSNQLNQVINNFESLSLETKKQMSKAAYEKYQANYTKEKHIEAIKHLYHFESNK